MPFPLIKLVYLGVKQVSRPLARMIKERAKSSPVLRNYILLPPAQWYHTLETSIKLRLLGMGKATNVKPLNEEMAIDLASEMLGEFIVFSAAAGTILFEYRRQLNKDQEKEDTQNQRLVELEATIQDMGLQLEQQSTQIRELTRLIHYDPEQLSRISRTTGSTSKDKLPETIKDSRSGAVLKVQKS